MENIKKYKTFEAFFGGSWDDSDGFWGDRKTSSYNDFGSWPAPMKKKEDIGKISLFPHYIDYINVDNMVYHENFGWGVVKAIRTDRNIFTINFKGKEKDIRPAATDMKISQTMAYIIKKEHPDKNFTDIHTEETPVEKPVEKKEETIEDLRKMNEGLQKRMREMSQRINMYIKEDSTKSSRLLSANETIKKLSSENDKLKKQLDEYEGLKDIMKEFKDKIDPFGEETWAKKKK